MRIVAIILLSILVFIWLAIMKIYETYIKRNILVQSCLYLFWTILTIRGLIWVAKPLINKSWFNFLHYFNISITITDNSVIPIVSLIIGIVIVSYFFIKIKKAIRELQ